jgi:hypothetical protein
MQSGKKHHLPSKGPNIVEAPANITHLPSSTFLFFLSPQFGSQEPGTNEEIKEFAAAKGFTGMNQSATS